MQVLNVFRSFLSSFTRFSFFSNSICFAAPIDALQPSPHPTPYFLAQRVAIMIMPGREVRPAYLALSVGAFVTFIFVTLVSFGNSNHLNSIREKVHKYK